MAILDIKKKLEEDKLAAAKSNATVATKPIKSGLPIVRPDGVKTPVTPKRTIPTIYPDGVKTPVSNRIVLRPGPPVRSNIRVAPRKVEKDTVAAPKYHTLESDPNMGWQERIARNRDLDANYRNSLGLQTDRYTAGLQSSTSTKNTRIGVQGDRDTRNLIEQGLAARQKVAGSQASALQEGRISANREENEAQREFTTRSSDIAYSRDQADKSIASKNKERSRRTEEALRLISEGRITKDEQVKDYATKGLGGVKGLRYGSASAPKNFKRIAPTYIKRLGARGEEVIEKVSPEGVFDPTTGASKYDLTKLTPEEKEAMLKRMLQ